MEGHSVEKDVRQPSTACLNHYLIIIIYNRDQPDQGRGFGVVKLQVDKQNSMYSTILYSVSVTWVNIYRSPNET